ncbi:MAG: serine/threonine-protein kinase [Chloroflexota bacterium]
MPLVEGDLLYQRYRINKVLGKGGMGAVYRALDESLGVNVAVKENLIEDEEALRQFKREATILANMRHPNLPRVTDHFVIDNQGQYLVMDYVEGEDLRQRLERIDKLPEKEVILVGIAICDALTYLHNLDPTILHRDIKPGNVKITPNGHVFLVDFGLAKIVQGSQQTTTGARGLTPGYSPPEQYGSARTDARSDVYSLGATLYASLTGNPPEDGLSIAINQTELTKVRDRSPDSSRMVAQVIERALNVQTEDRYQSAEELKVALLEASETVQRDVVVGEVTIAPPPPGSFSDTQRDEDEKDSPNGKPRKKKRRGGLIWALIFLFIAGAAAVYFLGIDKISGVVSGLNPSAATATYTALPPTDIPPTSPATEAVAAVDPTETPLPTETPTEAPTPTPAATQTGGSGQVAFASKRTGEFQIYYKNVDSGEAGELNQITDIPGGACQPNWSPDGQQLVFVSPCRTNELSYSGTSLFIINVDGSGLTPLKSSPLGDYDPDWSPDGRHIAFTSLRDARRPQIYVYDLETGDVTNWSGTSSTDFMPSWNSDGTRIAFVSTRLGPTEIWTMEFSGRPWDLFSKSPANRNNVDPVWSPDGDVLVFTQFKAGGLPYLEGATWAEDVPLRGLSEFRISSEAVTMKEADYSEDGNWITFTSNPTGPNHDIFIMFSSGINLIQVTFDKDLDIDPVWRPLNLGN